MSDEYDRNRELERELAIDECRQQAQYDEEIRNEIIAEFLKRCEEKFADWEDMEPTFKVLERIAKEMKGEV